MKRKNTKLAAIIATIVVSVAGLGAAAKPAGAAFNPAGPVGSAGAWLGAPDSTVCTPSGRNITSLSPMVGRAPTYTSSKQTIYMLPRLEIYNAATKKFQPYLYASSWQAITTSPGQYAPFSAQSYTNLPHGYAYRTGYHFMWYVGNTKIGEVLTYNSQKEYYQQATWDFPYNRGDFCWA